MEDMKLFDKTENSLEFSSSLEGVLEVLISNKYFYEEQINILKEALMSRVSASAIADPTLEPKMMKLMLEGLKENINLSDYVNAGFKFEQVEELYKGIKKGIDVKEYANVEYNHFQMSVIRNAIEMGLNIEPLKNAELSHTQMALICYGIINNLDISKYSNPKISAEKALEVIKSLENKTSLYLVLNEEDIASEYSFYQLQQIRLGMLNRVNVWLYKNHNIKLECMKYIRFCLENNIEIDGIKNYDITGDEGEALVKDSALKIAMKKLRDKRRDMKDIDMSNVTIEADKKLCTEYLEMLYSKWEKQNLKVLMNEGKVPNYCRCLD